MACAGFGQRKSVLRAAAMLAIVVSLPASAGAETLADALARVYQNNPQLTAQRAQLRAIDESVPQALSGYRPQVSVGASAGYNPVRTFFPDGTNQYANLHPWMAGKKVRTGL